MHNVEDVHDEIFFHPNLLSESRLCIIFSLQWSSLWQWLQHSFAPASAAVTCTRFVVTFIGIEMFQSDYLLAASFSVTMAGSYRDGVVSFKWSAP